MSERSKDFAAVGFLAALAIALAIWIGGVDSGAATGEGGPATPVAEQGPIPGTPLPGAPSPGVGAPSTSLAPWTTFSTTTTVPPWETSTTTTTVAGAEATTTLVPGESTTSTTGSTTDSTTSTTVLATGPDPVLAGSYRSEVPDWVVFPGEEWETATPAAAGLDPRAWSNWLAGQNPRVERERGLSRNLDDDWGVAITRGGYLIYTAGDPDVVIQSASVGKTFTRLALLIAERKGLIDSVDDLVRLYWKGDGTDGPKLSSPNKYMTRGHNADVTFRHLAFHRAGFPVTNGSEYAGDPFADNYAVRAPGEYRYSSGGMWRLSQALTHIFGEELKDVLDRELFQYIGIDPEDWYWVTGEEVAQNRNFYPVWNDGPDEYYGAFVDPPYSIGGNMVQGGGGWVAMSPEDLARVGLLIATDGYWDGRQLITPFDLSARRGWGNIHYLGNHSGFVDSRMEGDRNHYGASAWVRTVGFSSPPWGSLVDRPPSGG